MTSRQSSERSGSAEPPAGDPAEQPTVSLLTPEELAERRARERERGRGRIRAPRSRRAEGRPARRPPDRVRRSRSRGAPPVPSVAFVVSGAVAAAYVALSLADGGFEPVVWAAATILVWWTVVAVLLAAAWPRSPIPGAAAIAGGCLLALTALTGASLAWTVDLGAAFDDALRGAGYLGIFVLTAIAARAGAGRAFLAGLGLGLFVVCAISLLSRLEPGFVDNRDEARALRVSGGRLSWPLGYWNAIGAVATMAIPLLVWLASSAGTSLRRALAAAAVPVPVLVILFSGSRAGVIAMVVAIVVLILAGPRRVTLFAVLAITMVPATLLVGVAGLSPELINGEANAAAADAGDRVLVLTVVVMLLIAAAMLLADRRIAHLHVPVIGVRRAAVAAGVLASLLVGSALFSSETQDRLSALDDPPSTTAATGEGTRLQAAGSSGRAQFWETALDAVADEPLRGIGAGSFESYWALNGSLEFTVIHAHSLFFESAAELGVFAPWLALAIFLVPAGIALRRRLAPVAWAEPEAASGAIGAALAVLAAGFLVAAVDWIWDLPAAFVPVVVCAAYLCAPPVSERVAGRERPARRRGKRERRRRLARPAVGLAIFAVAAASIGASVVAILADRSLAESETAVASGNLRQAALAAEEAGEWLPFASTPKRQLAQVENARGRPAAARRAIVEAQDLASRDWQLWLIESGIEFSDGGFGRGLYALNRAQALNPKAPKSLFSVPSLVPTAADGG